MDLVRFTATSDQGWATTVRRNVGDVVAGELLALLALGLTGSAVLVRRRLVR